MDGRLAFEDLAVGQLWTSASRTITETDVINFANFTGDHNPLHIDYEFAKRTHYRQPIAHGLLGLSWVAGLGSKCPSVDTVAFTAVRNWEFVRPLFFGDTVHVETRVFAKQDDAKRAGRVLWELKLINQRGEVAQHGQFETLVRVRNPRRGPHYPERANRARPGGPSAVGSRRQGLGRDF
jgi:acyl dehydratase